jgi:hypothetical protein
MKLKENKVYLDVCALGRLYDDQSFPRIQIEKTAVDVIVANIKFRRYHLYYSPVHGIEISQNPDVIARTEIMELLEDFGSNCARVIDDTIIGSRAIEFFKLGFGPSDAFHAAYAEKIDAFFITCDDQLLRKCKQASLEIWYGTPEDFCRKERLL